jgi:hypothetical protein
MYLARAVSPQSEKLDHEPVIPFFALTPDEGLIFSRSVFFTSQEGIEDFKCLLFE